MENDKNSCNFSNEHHVDINENMIDSLNSNGTDNPTEIR